MNIDKILSELTLEEKAGLCSGQDFWNTKAVERLGIPSIMVADGPHGLRKQNMEGDHLGINDSIKAVCFPTGCTVASSFDKDLIYEMGEILGNECQAENVALLLGPAINIKRSPVCGRNFEYFSEDPYLSTTLATAQINGVQSKNVGTSMKHYLANNQEFRRMSSDSQIDERTFREIYLASYEGAVKDSHPWSVMCSYNKVNGTYASENKRILTEILRDEWGFEGFVVSDWGAVNDRVKGLEAGMDLEMPGGSKINDQKIVEAVKKGILDETVLDKAVKCILKVVDKYHANRNHQAVFDRDADHEKARKIAGESMVLLKNDNILPLDKKTKVAFIGEFAVQPRFQGGGSSHINCHKVSSAISTAQEAGIEVTYAKGYDLSSDAVDQQLIQEACDVAKSAEVAVVFAGLPDRYESEGYDRSHIDLPENHNKLIEELVKVQPNVVVVLHNGSPVAMPWLKDVKGVLEAYLSGQTVGAATIDILFGDVNPSGKLAETFPLQLEDNPSYLFYKGEKDVVEYREGIFIGYRYYDKKNMEVLFPFGYGLSYTTFSYDNLVVENKNIKDTDILKVSVDVKNTGTVAGKEVVQLYVSPSDKGLAIRPNKELKGFEKVSLNPGEKKTVSFELNRRSFAYFNTVLNDWYVESGTYGILVGGSSRDIQCTSSVDIESTSRSPYKFHLNSTVSDVQADIKGKDLIQPILERYQATYMGGEDISEASEELATEEMMMAVMRDLPLRFMIGFSGGAISERELLDLIEALNK